MCLEKYYCTRNRRKEGAELGRAINNMSSAESVTERGSPVTSGKTSPRMHISLYCPVNVELYGRFSLKLLPSVLGWFYKLYPETAEVRIICLYKILKSAIRE